MKVEKCKGFKDLFPAEMEGFRLIEGVFRDTCMKWGYREVRTPTLEYLYLFTSVGTLSPGMLRRVYSFLDWDGWSGERVVMKPDGTIPVARMYIEEIKNGLARLFYITNVFMFEETGRKHRESWQCGAELIGENTIIADVELVTLALDVLRKLDIQDISIRVSHAGMIRALLEKTDLDQTQKTELIDRILSGDTDVLKELKAGNTELVEVLDLLLRLKGKSSGFLKNIKALAAARVPQLKKQLDNFIPVIEVLDKLGCRYKIDLSAGKGFEYYTGIIFNIYVGKEIIGGGGRYDDLIPQMGGKARPAAGFAFYINSLMKLVETRIIDRPLRQRVLLKADPQAVKEALEVAGEMREAGITVELELGEEEAECGWCLEVQCCSPTFRLIDLLDKRVSVCDSTADLMMILGCEADDAEDCLA